jgi:large subunit ribosomal protein L4
VHAERDSIAIVAADAFGEPSTRQAADLLAGWGQARPTLVVLHESQANAALSFRNLARVAVLTPENVGVADLLGAASLLLSAEALQALTARANGTAAAGADGEDAA